MAARYLLLLLMIPSVVGVLVQESDIEYIGSFELPSGDFGESRFGFSGQALTPYTDGQGRQTLFLQGHAWDPGTIAQIEIPDRLVMRDNGEDLEVATVLQNFYDIADDDWASAGTESYMSVYGMLPYNDRLIVAATSWYDASCSQTASHGVSTFDLSDPDDFSGFYTIEAEANARSLGGYMTMIPDGWQNRLGGPVLTGNSALSIIGCISSGPAATVFDPDDLGTGTISGETLVYYPIGDYMVTGNSEENTWSFGSTVRGIAFPAGTDTVMFIGRLTQADAYCYGPGTDDESLHKVETEGGTWCYDLCEHSKGGHGYPYVHYVWAYDANDLLEVKDGNMEPWEVEPYAGWELDDLDTSGCADLRGVGFDHERNLIYFAQSYGENPVIDVFEIRSGNQPISISELESALMQATPGDTIIVEDGVYTDVELHLIGKGELGDPVIIRPETQGGVEFTGGETGIVLTGEYLVFRDFHFHDIDGNGVLFTLSNASYSRVTNNFFERIHKVGGVMEVMGLNPGLNEFWGSSTDNRVDHNTFSGNRRIEIENFILDDIRRPQDIGNINNRYDHNIFRDHASASQEEAFQLGRGSTERETGRGFLTEYAVDANIIVEFNLFENYNGDNEIISSKSSSNIIRHNIVKNCDGAITLRGGDDSIVDGNYFLAEEGNVGSQFYKGVVVHGTGHQVINNYIEGYPSGGHGQVYLSAGNSYNRPDVSGVLVANNCIKNSRMGVHFEGVDDNEPNVPTGNTVMNNICESTRSGDEAMYNAGTDNQFISNYGHCPDCDSGDSIEGVTDPGEFILTQPRSGRIDWYAPIRYDAGTPDDGVTTDIEGQSRGNPPHIGCDEDSVLGVIDFGSIGHHWSSCLHTADNSPCDGRISNIELFNFIFSWTGGSISNADLLEVMVLWKSG